MISGRSLALKQVTAANNSHWFYENYHVDPTNLVALWTMGNRQGRASGTTWPALYGNGVDLTLVNSPTVNATDITLNGTTQYAKAEEIDDETGVTSHQLATVATGARYKATGLDMSQYATESGDRQYRIVFTDSGGEKAWAYIGGADDAEAFGSTTVTDGTFDDWTGDDLDSWTEETGTVDAAADTGRTGGGFSAKVTIGGGGQEGIKQAQVVVPGTVYKFTVWAKATAGDGFRYKFHDLSNVVDLYDSGAITSTEWTQYTYYITAPIGCISLDIRLRGNAATDIVWFDDCAFQPVTSLGTTAVKLYSTVSGDVQSLTGDSGIDPNDISTIEIYKVLGDDNLTGDMTIFMVLKPADGQPAAGETIISRYDVATNNRSFALHLETNGKLSAYLSDTGAANRWTQTTDDAVYTNGSQAALGTVAIVINVGTGAFFYVNGSLVASTISAGAVRALLFDVATPVTIGAWYNGAATGFYNGAIGEILIFNTEATAAQVLQMHNAIKKRL